MSEKESIKNWVAIFVVLVLTSLVAVAWPSISGGFHGPSVSVSAPGEVPIITLPRAIGTVTEVNGFVVIGVLAVAAVSLVALASALIGGGYLFLAKRADVIKESKEFQDHVSQLEKKEQEQIQTLRNGRTSDPIPDHSDLRWSVLSTSLITLLLVLAAATIVNNALIPVEAHMMIRTFALSTRLVIVAASLLLTLLVLVWRMRPERFAAMEASDNGPIPWDSIWVILTGLVVVGIGIGFMVYLNIPG